MDFLFFKHKTTPEEKFWQWFMSRSDAYFHLENDQKGLLSELMQKLHKVNQHLTFQISTVKENNKREFIISADGIISVIQSVFALVGEAPNLDQWEIIAFRQRLKTDQTLVFADIQLSSEDIYFQDKDEGNKTGLILYIKNYYEEGSKKFLGAAFIYLDWTLGEYDVMNQIGSITLRNLNKTETKHLKPITSLASLIDIKKTKNAN